MSIVVSVIVPVYNAKLYIQECVASILEQTFNDFELILIDDGSTDGSGEICDELSGTDPRIKVFHQKNSGVSAARNSGIEVAKGKLICFIDSDDWVDNDFLAALINDSSSAIDADLKIMTDVSYEYQKKKLIKSPRYSKHLYKGQEVTEFLIENKFFSVGDGGCWSKLYKKELIDSDRQRFLLKNNVYEDTLFTLEYLYKCESLLICKGSRYHYRRNSPTSLSKSIHPYYNYLQSGITGLNAIDKFKAKYNMKNESRFIALGRKKFLEILNYSLFSLYRNPQQLNRSSRIRLLTSLEKINKAYMCQETPDSVKQRIVSEILEIENKRISDYLYVILFKVRAWQKNFLWLMRLNKIQSIND